MRSAVSRRIASIPQTPNGGIRFATPALQRHESMPRYIRAHIPGGTFFFTVALLERKQRLLVEHIDVLRGAFASVRAQRPFTIDAAVILPDHLHCILTLPEGDADISVRWHAIKSKFSRSLPKEETLSARHVVKGERGIWQRRFWEHTIRNDDDFARHMDYIHYNPVKHGHARRVCDWPYSTFHRLVQQGMYAPHWGAGDDVQAMDLE
jgi:putative transposase